MVISSAGLQMRWKRARLVGCGFGLSGLCPLVSQESGFFVLMDCWSSSSSEEDEDEEHEEDEEEEFSDEEVEGGWEFSSSVSILR